MAKNLKNKPKDMKLSVYMIHTRLLAQGSVVGKIYFCLCYWLIEETNAAEHYERTKFDLYKDDICLVLTLTYEQAKGHEVVCLYDQYKIVSTGQCCR